MAQQNQNKSAMNPNKDSEQGKKPYPSKHTDKPAPEQPERWSKEDEVTSPDKREEQDAPSAHQGPRKNQ